MKTPYNFYFHHDFRVRFSETDAQGIVHNSQYLVYFEIARVEYLRHIGLTYTELIKEGIDFVLASSHIDYRHSARFDDLLQIQAAIPWIRRTSFQFNYLITKPETNIVIVEGTTVHVSINHNNMKPCRILPKIRTTIMEFEKSDLIAPNERTNRFK